MDEWKVRMTSSESADTFVICYASPSDLWAAISIQTRLVGVGGNPREALANAINAVDQPTEGSTEDLNTHVCSSSHGLMMTLAKMARPLPDEDYTPGAVYKFERP